MSERLEAVRTGIAKWKGILASEISLREGTRACLLCKIFDEWNVEDGKICTKCPLCIIDKRCLAHGSTWNKYYNILEFRECTEYLKEMDGEDHATLTVLIKDMISHLEEAERWVMEQEASDGR